MIDAGALHIVIPPYLHFELRSSDRDGHGAATVCVSIEVKA